MFLRRLVGRTDMDNALQRLENMTQEETRMASAEALKAIHIGNSVGNMMQNTLRAVQGQVEDVENILQNILQGSGDRAKDIDYNDIEGV
jgi:hypothetical protein